MCNEKHTDRPGKSWITKKHTNRNIKIQQTGFSSVGRIDGYGYGGYGQWHSYVCFGQYISDDAIEYAGK